MTLLSTLFMVWFYRVFVGTFKLHSMITLADLKQGQKATIRSFSNDALSSRLLEMGCLPGESLSLSRTAPLGCPIAINIAGYILSLRREEAAAVMVELVA